MRIGGGAREPGHVGVDLGVVNARVKRLAAAQSDDIQARLEREGVRVVRGLGRLDGPVARGRRRRPTARREPFDADVVLVSTGARPRVVAGAEPDGERILTWEQVYDLDRRCPSGSSWSGPA